jgi:protein-S-isoprenylcysteine O-methyltransferase Ste14
MSTSITGLGLRRGTKAYDLLAALPLIAWYALSLAMIVPQIEHGFHTATNTGLEVRALIDLLSKFGKFAFAFILIVFLIARRTPIASMDAILPKAVALLGTYLGVALLVLPGGGVNAPMLLPASVLIFAGTTFGVYSLAWLGRSVSIMPESRKLVTSGPYSAIRHPLYLGEQMALVGVALQSGSAWAFGAFAVQFACQIYRMNYEEKVLSGSFPEYAAYMAQTKRLIPRLY